MVKFTVTQDIQRIIREYNNILDYENEVDITLKSIDHLKLLSISQILQKHHNSNNYSFNNILKFTSLYIEPKVTPIPVYLLSYVANKRIQNMKRKWRYYEDV